MTICNAKEIKNLHNDNLAYYLRKVLKKRLEEITRVSLKTQGKKESITTLKIVNFVN